MNQLELTAIVTTVLSAKAVMTTFCKMFSCNIMRYQTCYLQAELNCAGEMSTNRGHVYRCSGFIHDKDTALSDKRPGQAEELPLSHTEVLSSFSHNSIWRPEHTRQDCVTYTHRMTSIISLNTEMKLGLKFEFKR